MTELTQEPQLIAELISLTAGYKRDIELLHELNFSVGDRFDVQRVDIGDWHTSVRLEGYKQIFNSVNFRFFINGKEQNIFDESFQHSAVKRNYRGQY